MIQTDSVPSQNMALPASYDRSRKRLPISLDGRCESANNVNCT